jgi:lipopolysaccharide/colanic/teichoic acid biosynthesis glycosyltransferase
MSHFDALFPRSAGSSSRSFDFLAALTGLIVSSILFLVAAAAIWFEDGLPIFFLHSRIGRYGRRFRLVKLRSMRTGGGGPEVTSAQDSRITRVGQKLRKYKLDELPQLWNVLMGEMSLVGPRPEAPRYVDPGDPDWNAILCCRPGITDLATLVYRNEEEILARSEDPERYYREVVLPSKLALNIEYLRVRTFVMDLKLILLTIRYSFCPSGFDPDLVRQAFCCTRKR